MLSSFFGYAKKEEKPVSENKTGLDLRGLKNYIESKAASKTALEIGKYRLALLLAEDVEQRIKDKEIDYNELQRNCYVAYKVNEFLELPDSYASLPEPIVSVFNDRYGMQKLLEDSKSLGVELYSKREMDKLFRLFKKMIFGKEQDNYCVVLPENLPDYIKTGSGYFWGSYNLHLVIKDLYKQCQCKLLEKPKAELAVS